MSFGQDDKKSKIRSTCAANVAVVAAPKHLAVVPQCNNQE